MGLLLLALALVARTLMEMRHHHKWLGHLTIRIRDARHYETSAERRWKVKWIKL